MGRGTIAIHSFSTDMNIILKGVLLLQISSFLAQDMEDPDYVTEMVEDVTELEEVVVTTPITTPAVKTTSPEPLIEDDLVVASSKSREPDTVPVLLEMMDSLADDDDLELNTVKNIETEPIKEEGLAADEDAGTPRAITDEVEEDVRIPGLPGGWFYFNKPGLTPLYQTVQKFSPVKSRYWVLPRQWPARTTLNNEINDEARYSSQFAFYPFFGFHKPSQ